MRVGFNVRVASVQSLLFPDARPLVERLGRDFFLQLPRRPGVYLMHDARETIVYVGKAKDLRQRLGHYRVANPDRVPRRLLRLLKTVVRIEYKECEDEAAALATEAELLMRLKPKFNRAGVWPAPPRFLMWRVSGETFELTLGKGEEKGWETRGLMKGGTAGMLNSLARLLWVMGSPGKGLEDMPTGWVHGRMPQRMTFSAGLVEVFRGLLDEDDAGVVERMQERIVTFRQGWQQEFLLNNLERVMRFFKPGMELVLSEEATASQSDA